VRITPANKDALRERCFALHAQGISIREIASRLGIGSKNTVHKYIHQESRLRRYDPEAKEVLDRAIASLQSLLDDLGWRYHHVRGDGPHSMYARARLWPSRARTAGLSIKSFQTTAAEKFIVDSLRCALLLRHS
jgi:hypothetical protein